MNFIQKVATFLVFIFIIFLLPPFSFVQASVYEEYPYYDWYIPEYSVNMKLRTDGVLEVEETIVADFSEVSRRGIIRDIPYEYDFWTVTPIKVISVTNSEGEDWKYKVSTSSGDKRIRIGDSDVYWSEPLTYVIRYNVEGAINSFDENREFLGTIGVSGGGSIDELYWNAIGTDWGESPIGAYRVSLDLSEFENEDVIEYGCKIGSFGSKEECDLQKENMVLETSGDVLGHREAITLGVVFEGGAINPAWTWRRILNLLRYFILFIPFVVFGSFFRHWWKKGKDPSKKSIIPRYEIEENMHPMEVGTLIDEKLDNKDITAGIIELATKGYIKVIEIPKKGFFGSKKIKFKKLKEFKNEKSLLNFEKKILKGLFGSNKEMVELDNISGSFYSTVSSVRQKVFKHLVNEGFYKKNPKTVKGKYYGIAGVSFFIGAWLGGITQSVLIAVTFVSIAVSSLVFAPFMSKKTKKGMRAYEHVLGFKEFLKVAEKDRIKFFQEYKDKLSEKDKMRTFEKLLPYAMAFGMGDKWTGLFMDIFESGYNPIWYSGTSSTFNANSFSRSLNSIGSEVKAASVPPASSSASSGGSFSSGGFSGGGFGGGGGSSW